MAIIVTLHGKETTVTKSELFELARRGIIDPYTQVTTNGQTVLAGRVQGIVFGSKVEAAQAVPVPNSREVSQQPVPYQQSATQQMVVSTVKTNCLIIGFLLMVVCFFVCGWGNIMDNKNRRLARNLDTSQRSVDIANSNLNRSYTPENSCEAMKTIDQQRQSRMNAEQNSCSPDAIMACYSLGGTGFAVGFVLFIVGLALPSPPRQINAEPLVLGVPLTAKLTRLAYQFFVLDISETKPLAFTLDGYDVSNYVQLYVKHGSPPTLKFLNYDYDYVATGLAKQSIVIDKSLVGQYYVLLVGKYVPKPCNFTLLATQGV